MPSATTIKLLIAAMIVLGLVVIVGATMNRGTTAAPPAPIVRQIMRRHDRRKLAASASEIAELRRKAQDQEKRNLRIREFKDMPLKVKVLRNVESETWYKDLQIEVKNISTKPIYFMLAYLEFPDYKPLNRGIALDLTYGDLKYVDINVIADPQDLHLDPGETYVFTIPEKAARTLGRQHERAPEKFKKLDFHIDIISFGDRTGFEIGHPTDLRNKNQPDGAGNKKHHANPRVRAPPQDGCGPCRGYGIQFLLTCFNLSINEWCAPAPVIKPDSSKPCRLHETKYWDCDDDDFPECPRDIIYDSADCPGYTPTPTPTPTPTSTPTPSPTPTPTCDPATKPNDTNCSCQQNPISGSPEWSCSCFYTDSAGPWHGVGADYHTFPGTPGIAGCNSNGNRINNGGDCCVCAVTTCPEGSYLNRQTCQCETSSGGGGDAGSGGGGGNPPPIADHLECVDYYWVHFVSYDGGQTWHYDDRETYAGCYYLY